MRAEDLGRDRYLLGGAAVTTVRGGERSRCCRRGGGRRYAIGRTIMSPSRPRTIAHGRRRALLALALAGPGF
eukprot:COSAG01_NODE_302_length_19206_cov_11.098687_1_plen_71_part_10